MGEVVQIRDFHLKRLAKQTEELMGELLDYAEIAREGGPIVQGAVPCDPWARRHSDDLA